MFQNVCKGLGVAVLIYLACDVAVLAYEGVGACLKDMRENGVTAFEAHLNAIETATNEFKSNR